MEDSSFNIEANDALRLRSSKTITKQLEKGEVVLFSCEVSKHNKRGTIQKRTLLLTNRYLYNVDFTDKKAQFFSFLMSSLAIKRKIALVNIEAITVTTYYLSDQLIFHVPKEYDYRYSGLGKKRELLMKLVCKEYAQITGQNMRFYFKEAPDLCEYQTTDDDKAARVNKMPKEEPIVLGYSDLDKGLEFLKKQLKNSEIRKSYYVTPVEKQPETLPAKQVVQ